jgi:Ca2+-binding RTX toxin-like protein
MECLERRVCLSAVLTGNVLVIAGTAGNDVITVSLDPQKANYLVKFNQSGSAYPRSAVQSIEVDAGDGNDKITLESTIKLKSTLNGGAGNDTITGGAGGDAINGGDGDDQLYGSGGKDTIHGDAGNDLIQGGAADDSLFGDDGFDQVYGDAGNDMLEGGANDDTLGGDDEDVLYLTGKPRPADIAGNDSLDGGDGSDGLLDGVGTGQSISDHSGKDTLNGGIGRDVMDVRGSNTVSDTGTEDILPNAGSRGSASVTHIQFSLQILVNDGHGKYQKVNIPAGIGLFPDHTTPYHTNLNDKSGRIRLEADQVSNVFPLLYFFRTWGVTMNSSHVGRYVASSGQPITMTVNRQSNTFFGGYFPQNGDKIVLRIG